MITKATKRKLFIEKQSGENPERLLVRRPDSCSNIHILVSKTWHGERFYASITLHEEEILALERFITDWKTERVRVKAVSAASAARRKAAKVTQFVVPK